MRLFDKKHPSKVELLGYAGSLAGRAPLAASIGAHLTACKKCAAEVDAMSASLAFVAEAPALEVSSELTSRILVVARSERPAKAGALQRLWNPRRAAGLCAYAMAAACVALLSAAPVFLGYTDSAHVPERQAAANVPALIAASAETAPRNELLAILSEVEVLANAVRASFVRPQNAAERIRQRTVNAMDAEISAALAALERNPGCVRATQLVQNNLERQAETLRELYAGRSL